MNDKLKFILIFVGCIIAFFAMQATLDFFITYEDEEDYNQYCSIRDTCQCTIDHDAECINHSVCIHAYEYCQREACPECFVR